MKISSAFPSKYLKAADLQGKQVTVVMSHVTMETIGDDERPVLYFKGKDIVIEPLSGAPLKFRRLGREHLA